ncbi:PREDICTED: probable LRR receptor-like serine/threonine-protein kinase At3g47570 [Camelina sativa]|uniref:Probable LRR receptor-like serine/threonine-protein kinase At3g47570 n=1 Tax=Camelina sativa TaxID=90675 RepID=A0ABM0TGN9_CAMSA|nr:PREDICTED: probable LRR receptor-like serine/threonine-protein kinase At3g47570 [Camelina sativa]
MGSMSIFLLLAFNGLMLLEAHGFTDESDKQALLAFKSQVSEDKRVVLSSWNNSFPLCNWMGVTCGRKHKRVTYLELGGLQLGGEISPSIGNLSFLVYLGLSNNSFGGTIPQEVGNLIRLEYLYMGFNYLGGGIPTSISNCSRLLELDLYMNPLGRGVPSELGSLTNLVSLNFRDNNLKGKIPASLGNLTSLTQASFGGNNMEGEIPAEIARLSQMVILELSFNKFSGGIPSAIYNMSSLEYLYMAFNHFSGPLRPDFGILLPNIQDLNMGKNYLTGSIPTTFSNISTLQKVALNDNNLTGSIPTFRNVPILQWLILSGNSLGSYSSGDLEFISSLTNCTQLEKLGIGGNRLGGDLPIFIANLSKELTGLSLEKNQISGRVPHDIGNLMGLQALQLSGNMLFGPLPTSLGNLFGLGVLDLSSNKMSGVIPSTIGNLTRLEKLYLYNNSFEGTIPPSLGNCSDLLYLEIGYNKLNGSIPTKVMQLSQLLTFSMPSNSITGTLPKDVGRLEKLVRLSVSDNKLAGELSQTLGNCLSLEEIYLQGNSFDGKIPDIKRLVGVKRVDLSNNNLSGSIPGYFESFLKLEYLNLSMNNFDGQVPTKGRFQNSTIVLVFGNKNLCGGIKELKLKPCIVQAPPIEAKHPSPVLLRKVAIGVSVGITLLLLVFIVSLRWFRKRKKNQKTNNSAPTTLEIFHEKLSYGDLRNATDGFSLSNIVGSGSFGTVFKALLPIDNKIFAVKVLNMQRHGAMKSFVAECESLKDVRHRNLVKLLTACASIDFQGNEFRALIYEFMPNGSLDMWLHPEEVEEIRRPSRTLTLLERLNIAIDVVTVLDYLHVHCHEPIAHCDLKPGNVLLDDDLTAHVSDFGLARLLLKFDQESFMNQLSSAGVRGTIGYAAPEYGMGGQPSIHGDEYSFGVLLLEMFTGKRPTNELFGGNFTLHSYTKSALPEQVLDIMDVSILHSGLRVGFPVAECLKLVLELGLRCCGDSPINRLAMSEAAKELISIRERFFKARRTARR